MQELKELNLELLNKVWDGIKSGDLEHKQGDYFCGTACCVAGWICVEKAKELEPKAFEDALKRYEDTEAAVDKALFSSYFSEYWGYAQGVIGLTDEEAKLIFDSEATISIQDEVIRRLNEGERFVGYPTGESTSEDYWRVVSFFGLD